MSRPGECELHDLRHLRYAFLFLMKTAGQDDIGMTRGLEHKEVDDTEELEFFESLAREVGVRQ